MGLKELFKRYLEWTDNNGKRLEKIIPIQKILAGNKCPNCKDRFLNIFEFENSQEKCSECGFSQFTTIKKFLL